MRQCHHCKTWLADDEPHDCWSTTEAALTDDLSEDLRDAWERLRETAVEFGEQRIYASGTAIMFSRDACYFFVRPKRSFLELVIFLGRAVKAPQVRRVVPTSKVKRAHVVHVRHRDEVEAPITDWLREAYELRDKVAGTKASPATKGKTQRVRDTKPSARSARKAAARRRQPRRK
jgi:hypothetical protein